MFSRLYSSVAATAVSISLLSVPVFANEAVANSDEIEGSWQLENSNIQQSVVIQATEAGLWVDTKGGRTRCTFVGPATTSNGVFPLIQITGGCDPTAVKITTHDSYLSASIAGYGKGQQLRLRQVAGPQPDQSDAPDAAIRGLTLGMEFDAAKATLSHDMNVKYMGSSRRVVRGVSQLNGSYLKATLAYGGDFAASGASQDTIGVYRLNTSDKVVAIARKYAPAPNDAPTAKSFLAALSETYGPSSKQSKSGPSTYLTWHFDQAGRIASGDALHACARKVQGSKRQHVAAMLFSVLKFYETTGGAELDDTSTRIDLNPMGGCGYTLTYKVSQLGSGILKSADATYFDHRAAASDLWAKDKNKVHQDILRHLQQLAAAQNNAPKL